MSFDTNWDVMKYKHNHDIGLHWEVKMRFMLMHKDKFPEEQLVCWAQTFYNIEVLGCTYENEVMEKVRELSVGLEEITSRISKRNFVSASVAANERVKSRMSGGKKKDQDNRKPFVKGSSDLNTSQQQFIDRRGMKRPYEGSHTYAGAGPSGGYSPKIPNNYSDRGARPGFGASYDSGNGWNAFIPNRMYSQGNPYDIVDRRGVKRKNDEDRNVTDCVRPSPPAKPKFSNVNYTTGNRMQINVSEVMNSGPFGRIVVFENADRCDVPTNIIERTASASHIVSNFSFTNEQNIVSCRLLLDGIFLASGKGPNQKVAKEAACITAIDRLRETSFTVKVKAPFVSTVGTVNRDMDNEFKGVDGNRAGLDKPIRDDNIGRKMMKLMGWSGGGLGKNEQGIEEPLRPTDRSVERSGLGIQNLRDFRNKALAILEDYARSHTKDDLVFSPDFTKDERKLIHELTRKYNLKSRSFGKTDDLRHLVVFKKVSPWEIVEELVDAGGETDKYKLIPPASVVPLN